MTFNTLNEPPAAVIKGASRTDIDPDVAELIEEGPTDE